MESEIAVDCPPFIRIYKNGKIERLTGTPVVPASLDPQNGVVSKDIPYSRENNISARLYIPHKTLDTAAKLPLLVYIHGGGFLIETAFSTLYHDFLIAVATAADCVVVSVDYRLAPENPIPAAYDDSWAALEWVFAHFSGSGPEEWFNKHADFRRVFLAGDSAGANISHHMGMKAGEERLFPEGNGNGGYAITGIILVHPYFWAKEPIDEFEVSDRAARAFYVKVWEIASPNSESGCDDPRLNVVGYGPSLAGLGCERVIVMVAEKDPMVRQGLAYAAKLKKSEWDGEVEVVETKGEDHVFHLFNPGSENAGLLRKKFTDFIKGDK